MKLKCTLAKEGNACGFRDPNFGAIWIEGNTAGEIAATTNVITLESNTYVQTKAQYTAWSDVKKELIESPTS